MKMNMIIVAILALRFLIKLRFPANTPISTKLKLIRLRNKEFNDIFAITSSTSDF